MACNCNTKEQLDALYRMYGEKQEKNKEEMKSSWNKRIKYGIWQLAIIILLIPCIPIIFIYFLLRLFWEDSPKVNINNFDLLKILRLNKNVG